MEMNPITSPKQAVLKNRVDDTDVALVIKYVGAQASASITVSSGDITFKQGPVGSLVVDPSIDSGGNDPGVIDVSDANANTFGEVVDLINASSNWKAYLVGALRADNANASTGSLLDFTERTLTPGTDSELVQDTSKVLNMSIRVGSRTKVNGTEEHSAAEIYRIISKNTFGSGTSLIQVYEIDEAAKSETKVFEKAGGATTVEQDLNFVADGRGSIATSKTGKHLVVRMIGSAACTGYLQVNASVARGA